MIRTATVLLLLLATRSTFGQIGRPPGDDIRRGFASGDANTRIEALIRAGELGDDGRDLVADIERLAKSGDLAVRVEAIETLGRMGRAATNAAPTLATIVADETSPELTRLTAIDAIRRIDPPVQQVRPSLERALAEDELAFGAAFALVSLEPKREDVGPLVDVLLATLRDANASSRRRKEAALALAIVGKPALDGVIASLASDSPDVRAAAAEALGSMGPDAAPATDALARSLAKDEPAVRRQAARALGEIGARDESVLAAIERSLADADPGVRSGAVEALGRLAETGPLPKTAVGKIGQALDDPAGEVAAGAALALERVGPEALETLAKELDDENARALAAAVIGQIAEGNQGRLPESTNVVPQLLELMRASVDRDGERRPDPTTREEVFRALASLAPSIEQDERLVAKLREVVEDESFESRPMAVLAYARIAGRDAIPTLRKTVEDADDDLLRASSAIALVRVDPNARSTVAELLPQLMSTLEDEKSQSAVRRSVLAAMRDAGPKGLPRFDPATTRRVVAMLRDEDPSVRVAAIQLLGDRQRQADPLARRVITTALRAALRDPDADVRNAARRELDER